MGRHPGVSVTERILDAVVWVSEQEGKFTKEDLARFLGVSSVRAHEILRQMHDRLLVIPDEPLMTGRTTMWLRPEVSERDTAPRLMSVAR